MSGTAGPAFPVVISNDRLHGANYHSVGNREFQQYGLSIRDWFAGKALPSCIGVLAAEGNLTQIGAAESAYAYADAMITARSKS